jgi:hypothetical protein
MRIDENEVTTVNGGLGLIDIAAKRRTLFLTRLRAQGERAGTLTAAWLQVWDQRSPRENHPNIRAILRKFEYICIYVVEWAYVVPRRQEKSHRAFKRRLYGTPRITYRAEYTLREVG